MLHLPQARVYSRGSPGHPLPIHGGLRGQFLIRGPYPYGPHPGAADNPFFMNELNQVWLHDLPMAERIVSAYTAKGANHITAGPVIARGYDGVYPADDWRGQGDKFADYIEWVQAHGLTVSLWVLNDAVPYYDNRARTFDWAAVERDFTPIYANARLQRAITRVVYMWEDYQASSEMVKGYDYLRRVFPHAKRYWHSPKGHLSPGLGTEEERRVWDLAAAHGIHGLYLQARPVDDAVRPGDRHAIDQMKYDLWDMVRRFRGTNGSPWGVGRPILSEKGTPLEVVYAEGTAHAMYHSGAPDALGASWAAAALSVAGVVDVLDGLP